MKDGLTLKDMLIRTSFKERRRKVIVPIFPQEIDEKKEEIHYEVADIIVMDDGETLHLTLRELGVRR